MINPARAAFKEEPVEIQKETLEALGFEPVTGPNFFARRGYLAGSDAERAADIHHFFADPGIQGIWSIGGWGSARLLPLLDYDLIRRNPKALVGFSDVTSLLNAIHHETGLVTFHGPYPYDRKSATYLERVLIKGETVSFTNPSDILERDMVQRENRFATIRGGKARGHLVGGNLTVLSAIVGSPYLPEMEGAILFLEDVREAVYRVDRMITQLALAGVLKKLAGVVFGRCTDCESGTSYGSLTLEEVLRDHFEPLGVPAFRGAMIGHIRSQFALPIGTEVEIDADAGSIRMLEPAVS